MVLLLDLAIIVVAVDVLYIKSAIKSGLGPAMLAVVRVWVDRLRQIVVQRPLPQRLPGGTRLVCRSSRLAGSGLPQGHCGKLNGWSFGRLCFGFLVLPVGRVNGFRMPGSCGAARKQQCRGSAKNFTRP